MADKEKVQITAQVPKELADRLERVAEERIVGKGYLVQRAVTELLDRIDPDDVDPLGSPPPNPADWLPSEEATA